MKKIDVSISSFALLAFFSIPLFAQEAPLSRLRILKKNQNILKIEAQEAGTHLVLQGTVNELTLKLRKGSTIDATGIIILKKLEIIIEEKLEPGTLILNAEWTQIIESIFPIISEDLQSSFPNIQKEHGPSKITIEKGENCLGYFINIEPSNPK